MKWLKQYLWIIIWSLTCVDFSYALKADDFSVEFSDNLSRLSTFEDIVVVQRRFLQKTGRFEISPSASIFFSSEFFFQAGLGANISFYFLEKHGFELKGFYLFQIDRGVATDVYNNLRIDTAAKGVNTISFIGLLYKWTPIYGKTSWKNKKIIPFDFSVVIGGGMSQVEECRNSKFSSTCLHRALWLEPTLSLGFVQSYALSRNFTLRMDISSHYYGGLLFSKQIPSDDHYWDTHISFNCSFYFPRRIVR